MAVWNLHVSEFTVIAVAAITAYAAPNGAFALLVLLLCVVAMCVQYKESNKAKRVIASLCVDLARVNETLETIKREPVARV
jgi:hypothetical protein